MRFLVLSAALFQAVGLAAAQSQCPANGNNCARAVAVTFVSQSASRRGDCSSFQRCTVTPATSTIVTTSTSTPPVSTVTSTVSITSTVTPGAAGKRRAAAPVGPTPAPLQAPQPAIRREVRADDVVELERRQANTAVTRCPTAVPTYASQCTTSGTSSGTSLAYASACSCAGVSKSYTTIATPLTTSTSTTALTAVTTTTTTTVVVATQTASPANPAFAIRLGSTGSTYLDTSDYLHFTPNIAVTQAYNFVISNGVLARASDLQPFTVLGDGAYGYISPYAGDGYVDIPASLGAFDSQAGGFPLTLTLATPDCYLGLNAAAPPAYLIQIPGNDQFTALPGPLYAVPL